MGRGAFVISTVELVKKKCNTASQFTVELCLQCTLLFCYVYACSRVASGGTPCVVREVYLYGAWFCFALASLIH